MVNTWNDEELAMESLEHFSTDKLIYFCLKAMEALLYLHSKDIYYGDMKPENLLIFKDYGVKLGDLGISVKMVKGETEHYLKGYSNAFSSPDMRNACELGEAVTREQLFLFDRYQIWKTFNSILKRCPHSGGKF